MNNAVVRNAVAVVAGLIAAMAVVFLVEALGHMIFPPPQGIDLSNPADQERLVAAMPAAAKAMVVVAWFLGSIAGAAAAMAIARKAAPGWFIALAMACLSVWTTQMFPHPAWMIAAAVILPFAAAWIATRLLAHRLAAQPHHLVAR